MTPTLHPGVLSRSGHPILWQVILHSEPGQGNL